MPESSNWCQVVSHIDGRFGGIASMVPRLAQATGSSRMAFLSPGEEPTDRDERMVCYPRGWSRWLSSGELRKALIKSVRASSGLHVHGIWEEHCAIASRAASRAHRPYVVSAHGMLDPWAFRNKHFKKQVYLRLVERATLAHASCLHALTRREAQCYREFGLKNPVAVIANGVDVPEAFSANEFLRRHEELRGRRLVLFLGRVHYKKGLDILSRAWAQVSRRFDDAHLVIAGPDFENTQAGVKATLDALNVGDRVTFTGMLPSALKWSALAAASVFILPSYSEGFSVAALEAMAAGLPVIVSEACNFPRVAEEDAGWVVTPTAEAVEDSLIQALSLRSCELAAYGRRGEQLVSRHYTWAGIGEQMRSLYEWLQGGAFPRNVEFA